MNECRHMFKILFNKGMMEDDVIMNVLFDA